MSIDDAAKAFLSGEYSRRRGYLSGFIYTWNGFALSGTIAIWGLLLNWGALVGQSADFELFATQVAWASALSSILLGFWRLYAHYLDDNIMKLYAVMYVCERTLLPPRLGTLSPPKALPALEREHLNAPLLWQEVHNSDFGGRAHGVLDWIAGGFVALFGAISLATALHLRVIRITLGAPHLIGWLLLGNIFGACLIWFAWRWWSRQKKAWPIPPEATQPTATPDVFATR